MAGFGASLGWGDNPWYKAFDANRSAIVSGFAGLGAARPGNIGGGFAQGFAQGMPMDQQRAERAAEEAKLTEQTSVTRSWLEQQGFSDLVPLVDAGQADIAYGEALKRMQPQAAPGPIKVGAGETLLDPVTMEPLYTGPADQGDQFGYEKDLYSQYSAAPPVKLYQEVKSGYERVRTSAVQNTGAGDVGLVYGYMKMLDPGSVVREGEFATAESTAGLPQQIVGLYNKLISGERLTPSQKAQFVQAAEGLYNETVTNLQGVNDQFSTRAQAWQVNPSNFLVQPESFGPLDMGGGAPRTTSTGVTWSY